MTYQAGIAISWPMLFICIYRYDQVKHDEDDTKVTKADDLMLQAQKMKKKRKKKNYSQNLPVRWHQSPELWLIGSNTQDRCFTCC